MFTLLLLLYIVEEPKMFEYEIWYHSRKRLISLPRYKRIHTGKEVFVNELSRF